MWLDPSLVGSSAGASVRFFFMQSTIIAVSAKRNSHEHGYGQNDFLPGGVKGQVTAFDSTFLTGSFTHFSGLAQTKLPGTNSTRLITCNTKDSSLLKSAHIYFRTNNKQKRGARWEYILPLEQCFFLYSAGNHSSSSYTTKGFHPRATFAFYRCLVLDFAF